MKTPSSQLLFSLTVIWSGLIGLGLWQLHAYANSAGSTGEVPVRLPDAAQWQATPDRSTLLVFVHPHCPCSSATVEELDRLMAVVDGRVDCHVIFIHPTDSSADWHHTSLWRRAERIPGISLIEDVECRITRQFGAQTSGQTVLYDRQGRLQFNGGITVSRGHTGDSPGRRALLTSLGPEHTAQQNQLTACEVFGCPLFSINGTAEDRDNQ